MFQKSWSELLIEKNIIGGSPSTCGQQSARAYTGNNAEKSRKQGTLTDIKPYPCIALNNSRAEKDSMIKS